MINGEQDPMRCSTFAFVISTSLLVVGCAPNPYTKFYTGNAARDMEDYVPSTSPLEIYSSEDFARDVRAIEKLGFIAAGSSHFDGGAYRVSDRQLLQQAKKVGSAAVIVSSHYKHSVSATMPLTLPSTSSSDTIGENMKGAVTYDRSRPVNYPYERSEFAVYFAKSRPLFGISPQGSARGGVLVDFVVDGSPAFRAGILPGDVVLTVDGEPVVDNVALYVQTHKRRGQEVVVEIERSGTLVEKRVSLVP
jgi:S1-C subfamily serine protease